MPEMAATPGQTVGPFFHYGLVYPGGDELAAPGRGDAIRLHGTVTDGVGAPVPDAIVEMWQADSDGAIVTQDGSLNRDGWTFTGWGRAATDASGHYTLTTVVPGSIGGGDWPFFAITVLARGLLDALHTRAYLPRADPVPDGLLDGLDDRRRQTLMCHSEPGGYRFDIHLQGAAETVFLTYRRTPA